MKRNRLFLLALLLLVSSQIIKSQSNVSYPYFAGNAGYYNSSFGWYAGSLVTGNYNTFNGYYAGKVTDSGNQNVFNGAFAGYSNTFGSLNVYIGYKAGYSASEAHRNVAIGLSSGYLLSDGSDNIFFGTYSGYYTTTGEQNVYLGYGSGFNTTDSGNIFIGYAAGFYETGSNQLFIENSISSAPLIYGDFDSDFVTINGKLGIGTSSFENGQLVVNGKIRAEKISITTNNFPDYVFDKDYHLLPLRDLEGFIKVNGHLPGIKSKAVAINEGISLSEMNVQLLEKIEELTLHVIELDKKRAFIKAQNKEIQQEIEKIRGAI